MPPLSPSPSARRQVALAPLSLMLLTALNAMAADPGAPVAEVHADASAVTADSGKPSVTELPPVVVTAQKRSQDIKSVPVSISVLGGEELKAERIGNYEDISRAVPGVSFNTLNGSDGMSNVVIRGVSSTAGSSTVGVYLDDVSITVKNFYDGNSQPRLLDLERVEVLRGPQGTLWGASSEGGTIRFISQAPNMQKQSGEITGDVSATRHGNANYSGGAVLNLPINPGVFAVRGSFSASSDSGYIDNYRYSQPSVLANKGVNAEKGYTLHLLGKITPGDDLTITPGLFYQRVRSNDNAAFYPDTLGLLNQNKQVPESGTDTMELASLSIHKGLGFADFTSVTGAFQRQFDRQEDGTYFNSTAFAQFFLDPLYPTYQTQNDTIIANLPSYVEKSTRYTQFSQEFRLSSTDEDAGRNPLKWVGGLYYATQTIHNTNFQTISGINQAFQNIYGIPMEQSLVNSTYGAPGVPALFPQGIDEYDNRTYSERQMAVFGQLDYDLTPDWHAGLGLRYVYAAEDFVSNEIGFYQIGNISPYNQEATFTAFTPKFTVTHDLDRNSKVYASAGKGFRLGGPTGPIVYGPTSVCNGDFQAIGQTSQPIKFDSDSLWSYELGSKNSLADRTLSLDAAVFYTRWKDIQQQIYLPTCGYYFTANVGDAKIYGGEIEAAYRPLSNLRLSLALSSERATITRTNNALTVPLGSNLIDVPGFTYTAGAVYHTPVSDTYDLTTRISYAWTGHSYGNYLPTNSNYANPGYGVVDLSVALGNDQYEFSLYAKNALNDQTIIQRPQINTVFEGYTVRPRTIGLTARMAL